MFRKIITASGCKARIFLAAFYYKILRIDTKTSLMEMFSGESHHTNSHSIKAALQGPKQHAREVTLSWPLLKHRHMS